MIHKIHKYIRVKVGKNKRTIFRCSFEGCVHKVLYEELVIGRKSICNRCDEEYIITKATTRLAKMHCDKCTISPKQEKLNKIKELALVLDK